MQQQSREHILPFVHGRARDECGCTYERYGHQEMDTLGTQEHPVITHVFVSRCPMHAAAQQLLDAVKMAYNRELWGNESFIVDGERKPLKEILEAARAAAEPRQAPAPSAEEAGS